MPKIALASSVILLLAVANAPARTWTSASGAVQIEAELVEKRPDGTVVLKRADGTTLQSKLEKFSADDQQYIRSWTPADNGGAAQANNSGEEAGPGDASPAPAALSPDEKAVVAKIRSPQSKSALAAFEKKEAELASTYVAKQKEYREKLKSLLEEAMKESASGGKLDEALAIRNAIKALDNGQEPPVSPAAAAAPADGAKDNRAVKGRIFASCDDEFIMCVNGKEVLRNSKAHQITMGDYAFSKGDVITVWATDIGGTRGFCCAIKMQRGRNIFTSPKWMEYTPQSELEWFKVDGAKGIRPVQPGNAFEEFAIVRNVSGINAAVIWGTDRDAFLTYTIP